MKCLYARALLVVVLSGSAAAGFAQLEGNAKFDGPAELLQCAAQEPCPEPVMGLGNDGRPVGLAATDGHLPIRLRPAYRQLAARG